VTTHVVRLKVLRLKAEGKKGLIFFRYKAVTFLLKLVYDFCQPDDSLFNILIPWISATNPNEIFVFFGSGAENAGKYVDIILFCLMI